MKSISNKLALIATVVVVAVSITGCGESLPTTVEVTGTVTFQGQPLSEGTVTFHPEEVAADAPRRPAVGQLNAAGRFALTTFRAGDGAVPGSYRVTVHSYHNRPGQFDDLQIFVPKWRIPQRYGDPSSSGLVAAITEGQPIVLPLELTH